MDQKFTIADYLALQNARLQLQECAGAAGWAEVLMRVIAENSPDVQKKITEYAK